MEGEDETDEVLDDGTGDEGDDDGNEDAGDDGEGFGGVDEIDDFRQRSFREPEFLHRRRHGAP